MTREEVIANVEAKIKRIKHIMDEGDYGCVDIENWEHWAKQLEYQEIILAALLGPQPDPDTGLVPCGCGTHMLLMGDDETQYWVECGDSVHCPHFIGQAYDGAGIYQTPEEAIKAARVAMGWKGGAE